MSPKDFAAAIGVSESSVKRWVDQGLVRAIRTAGGHRRIAPDEAARWIREHRVQPSRPDRSPPPVMEPAPTSADALRAHADTFYDHLHAGRGSDARMLALRLFVAGHSIASIADVVIAPAMARIGALYQHGEEGVFFEHRATDIAVHVVKEIEGASADQSSRTRAPTALSAALLGDHYAIAPMLVAATMGEVGFKATNLGPNTPTSVIELAVERLGAQLVAISVSVPPDAALVADVLAMAQRLRQRNVRMAVGGRFVDALGLQGADGVYVGTSMSGLAGFARSTLSAH